MAGKIKPEKAAKAKPAKMRAAATTSGTCLCGGVEVDIDTPVFWAWHDHSAPTRLAHGAAYATYVGCWKSKVRIVRGEELVSRFADTERGHVRSFCSRCGSPVMFERGRSPKMVNLPRALFAGRTGRESKYHVAIGEMRDWVYLGAPVGPLKGYPGVTVEKGKRAVRKRSATGLFEP
ncbi:MAG: GFA family protein [Hyphomonadaceae bacterium]